jgi:hypothetical protein
MQGKTAYVRPPKDESVFTRKLQERKETNNFLSKMYSLGIETHTYYLSYCTKEYLKKKDSLKSASAQTKHSHS